jgi:hypothetical protein
MISAGEAIMSRRIPASQDPDPLRRYLRMRSKGVDELCAKIDRKHPGLCPTTNRKKVEEDEEETPPQPPVEPPPPKPAPKPRYSGGRVSKAVLRARARREKKL